MAEVQRLACHCLPPTCHLPARPQARRRATAPQTRSLPAPLPPAGQACSATVMSRGRRYGPMRCCARLPIPVRHERHGPEELPHETRVRNCKHRLAVFTCHSSVRGGPPASAATARGSRRQAGEGDGGNQIIRGSAGVWWDSCLTDLTACGSWQGDQGEVCNCEAGSPGQSNRASA